MNYTNIYNSLINKASIRDWKSNKWKKGSINVNFPVEVHHITPRSMGGENKKSNLVVLSPKEHFIAHLLLTKIYPDHKGLNRAFIIMCNRTNGKSAENYSRQMTRYREIQSEMSKSLWTPEMKSKASARMTELCKDSSYIGKVSAGVKKAYETTDLRYKVSEASKANWSSLEYRERVSESLKAHWTDERREKASEFTILQNKQNPELSAIRSSALKNHQESKSKEWSERAGKWMNDWYTTPGNESILSDRYFQTGNKFNNSRVVVNIETGEEYRSLKYAAEVLNINYSTIKKYIYTNNSKCPVRFKED